MSMALGAGTPLGRLDCTGPSQQERADKHAVAHYESTGAHVLFVAEWESLRLAIAAFLQIHLTRSQSGERNPISIHTIGIHCMCSSPLAGRSCSLPTFWSSGVSVMSCFELSLSCWVNSALCICLSFSALLSLGSAFSGAMWCEFWEFRLRFWWCWVWWKFVHRIVWGVFEG